MRFPIRAEKKDATVAGRNKIMQGVQSCKRAQNDGNDVLKGGKLKAKLHLLY